MGTRREQEINEMLAIFVLFLVTIFLVCGLTARDKKGSNKTKAVWAGRVTGPTNMQPIMPGVVTATNSVAKQ